MKTGPYRRIEKAVGSADGQSIRQRWEYGRLLVVDDEATTPNGNLRHGVLDKLIAASEKDGRKLSDREIRYRVQVAKNYPTEEQIGNAVADFGSWHDLIEARFPAYPEPQNARPYDPRSTKDLVRDHDDRGQRLIRAATQLAFDLFPKHDETSTLDEIQTWIQEQDEITARYVKRGEAQHEHFNRLAQAVGGDLTKTLGEAAEALDALGDDEDD